MRKAFVLCFILCLVGLAVGLTACNKATVVRVELGENPTKSNYYEGESLDLTGCTLNVFYSDNSIKNVAVTEDMVSPFNAVAIGPKTLIVSYEEGGKTFTTTLLVHVVTRPASALSVVTPPTKAEYVVGETVDISGLTVEVYYTETQRNVVAAAALTYTPVVAKEGMTSVRVGWGNLTLDVPITVSPVRVSDIRAELVEPNLYRNQTLTPALFAVYYIYNTGEEHYADDWSLAEAGTVVDRIGYYLLHLTASHDGAEYACTVDASAVEDEVLSIALASAPQVYAAGDVFHYADVTLSVQFAHSWHVQYALGTDNYAGIVASIPDGTVLSEGAPYVTLSVGDRALCRYRIAVGTVAPVSWRTVGVVDTETYRVGDIPTPNSLHLFAEMSDGSEILVWKNYTAAPGISVTLPEPAVAGQTRATLVYDGLEYTYAIRVEE